MKKMISESDKTKIRDLAKRYRVKKVILFGSSCDPSRESHDIDLAVEGSPPSQFFKLGLPRFVGLGSRLGQFSARYTRLAWLYYCE